MKRLITITLIFLCSFAFVSLGNEPKESRRIPISKDKTTLPQRSLTDTCDQINCLYLGATSVIQTTVFYNFGLLEIIVTNVSTGEQWSGFLDTTDDMTHFLPISGNLGYYQIEYVAENGDVFRGEFTI